MTIRSLATTILRVIATPFALAVILVGILVLMVVDAVRRVVGKMRVT